MFIKKIVIEGVEGDVEISRTETGAVVTANDIDAEIDRDMTREDRYAVAWNAAKVICGKTNRGEPNATNSMIHDVLDQIDRVAGC
ncbi:MAG: hypothetical protein AAF108_11920 [Planctomycetota bacterium]